MAFQFRPARRKGTKLLIGLAGPTGAGKTYSALLLATGIVEVTGGKIAYLDTESGRAKQYAPPGDAVFEFDHCELPPPFSPDRYRDAFEAAEKHVGPGGVVIIDSVSHEHEGPGGVLEWHDAEMQRMGGERMTFPAWAKPKAARRKLINRILQSRSHMILCFRAKQKSKPVKVIKNGREVTEIVDLGWQPVTGDEWPYELTIFALLNPEKKGQPIIDGFDFGKLQINMQSLLPTDAPLTSDVGRRLAKWAGSAADKEAPTASRRAPCPPHDPETGEVQEMTAADRRAAMEIDPPKPGGGIEQLLPDPDPDPARKVKKPSELARDLAAAFDDVQNVGQLNSLLGRHGEFLEKVRKAGNPFLDDAIREARVRIGDIADEPEPAATAEPEDDWPADDPSFASAASEPDQGEFLPRKTIPAA